MPVRMRSPAPPSAPCGASHFGELREERLPGADLAELGDHLRAIGIVEPEDRGLRESVRRAEARGMVGIALDLRRPAEVALDQDASGIAAQDKRARIVARLPRDPVLRLADIGDDLLERLRCARAGAGERERRPHETEETAPAHEPLALQLGERLQVHRQSVEWSIGHRDRVLCVEFVILLLTTAQRWQTEQLIFDCTWYSAASVCLSSPAAAGTGSQPRSQIASRGLTCGAGSRWQSRQNSILSEAPW